MCATTLLLLTLILPLSTGCLPRTFVRKNPSEHDRGIRYYRPKPYLMLKPMIADKAVQPDMVEISIEYLPDFEEEYSIHIRSGLGVNDTSIKLENGWNLTSLSVKADSQTDENIEAVGNLLGSVARLTGGDGVTEGICVKANNVPMGLYEAVISPDACGVKRLYGFRYVGFFPFAACPLESCGLDKMNCHTGEVYGLVWEENTMVFRPLGTLPDHISPEKVKYGVGSLDPVEPEREEDMPRPTIYPGTPYSNPS